MSNVPRNIFPERKVAAGHSLVAKGLVEGCNVGGVMGMYISPIPGLLRYPFSPYPYTFLRDELITIKANIYIYISNARSRHRAYKCTRKLCSLALDQHVKHTVWVRIRTVHAIKLAPETLYFGFPFGILGLHLQPNARARSEGLANI
jgi:hypothetical protein